MIGFVPDSNLRRGPEHESLAVPGASFTSRCWRRARSRWRFRLHQLNLFVRYVIHLLDHKSGNDDD